MPYLDPYSGNWTAKEARHLLRRTSFGVTQTLVETSVSLGLTATINALFTEHPLPDPPVKYIPDEEVEDPDANFGETWIDGNPRPGPTNVAEIVVLNGRQGSFYGWSILQMQNAGMSIREKLTLFWHNHFVSQFNNPIIEYIYIDLLRTNAFASFRELAKKITVDRSMLTYLSGSLNTNEAPNENYARELLELFTIGKGPNVGNGDYTNYTEADIVEIAKVLTGWYTWSLDDPNALNPGFLVNTHTSGSKTLSHRFDNAVIAENGEEEYKDLIDVIFQQDECSRFIIRQLYIWFVRPEITADVETNIIEPLALIVRNDDYAVTEALKTLVSSEHFFENVACMVKSPLDLFLSATKSLLGAFPTTTLREEYEMAHFLFKMGKELDQGFLRHPDVAGWKAYYQEPLYDKIWINNLLLPKRLEFCKKLIIGGYIKVNGYENYTFPPLVPVLAVTAGIPNSQDPNVLIAALSNQLFNYEVNDIQKEALKEILIPGLPDVEWTIEYTDYLSDPDNEGLKMSIEAKLRNLITTMVQMPEFQIM